MGAVPPPVDAGSQLLERLSKEKKVPLTVASLVRRPGAAADAALIWIAQNLELALAAIRRSQDNGQETRLFSKLQDDFVAAFAEVRSLAQLERAGLRALFEPDYPSSGPDLRVLTAAGDVDVEVTSLSDDDGAKYRSLVMQALRGTVPKQVKAHLADLLISVWQVVPFSRDSKILKTLLSTVRREAEKIANGSVKLPATLFFSTQSAVLAEEFHYHRDEPRWADPQHPSVRFEDYDTIVVFQRVSSTDGPVISVGSEFQSEDPVKLRRKVYSKIRQLSSTRPGVLVLDVSSDEFGGAGVLDALFGTTKAVFTSHANGDIDTVLYRAQDGAFHNTSRVSAVVTTSWGMLPDFGAGTFQLVAQGERHRNPDARHPVPDEVLAALKSPVPFPPH